MEIRIRPARESDSDFILRVNEENVQMLAPMDAETLAAFSASAELFLIAEAEGRPAAFLIALREGAREYGSENYRWFCRHFPKFLYVDRIVIDEGCRRLGIGRKLYDAVFAHAAATGVGTVTAEIDTIPYNAVSLAFHKALGFREIGTQYVRDGAVRVSLQAAELNGAAEL